MRINEEVATYLEENPIMLPDTLTPEIIVAIREINDVLAAGEVGQEVLSVENRTIPGPDGDVPVRIYTPAGQGKKCPAIVYYHGGGWTIGSLISYDAVCRRLANVTGNKVISVGYRLAPEHRFPKGLEDCYAATQWVFDHAEELQLDDSRISIGGDSAGGNLAAAVTLMSRERKGPQIYAQILIYPAVDALRSIEHTPYESIRENAQAPILTSSLTKSFWDHYIQTEADGENVYASPIKEKDLSNLPPALVITAEYDPICDEGEAYADRLKKSGVPVKRTRYDGLVHGFLTLPISINEQVLQSIAEFLETDAIEK
ncbi:alpha/beta hydrolase [Sporosarcina sp. G11-34]|uniref:alpha/beta hydrolase n=1 Tax=Sporosarcina sp. G11-34 TaxID=2849605 RepID=UPI0022A8E103|nr:alpha/beta hydrolase [Sporosarcina sp. G11-34]MCZ2257758.1 alpha/beta hydrolase [Sporosarcina sp. G11-34]